jgi:acetyl-CoA carboxylase carboxyltransferase component/pyruvate/2-oxoglutarate dehydrogenase complex dihydrolipoamide acyltransferase (E2) component
MVVALAVARGDRVTAGSSLGRLEAMKMEIGFDAPITGVVKEVFVHAGQQVAAGELLLAIEPDGEGAAASSPRLTFQRETDPLDSFFADESGRPDLARAEAAPERERLAAMETAREEVRRVLMGYDVDLERGEKLAAFLEAPLPNELSESFRWELAAVRHELVLFADIEQLFSRAPLPRPTGEAGPSSRAILLDAVRRYHEGGAWLPEAFRASLLRALAHYGVADLTATDSLERAFLRLLASQAAPELRRRLVLGCLARVHALGGSGLALGDDGSLDEVLERIAGLRGHVSDAIADLSLEARYAIFEGPRLENQAERTTKEVESWLAAAEAAVTHPPESVLAHLAGSPRAIFDRVGRWLSDPDPRRRAVAVAAHVRRLYAQQRPLSHTSGVVGPVHVERLDLAGDRVVLGSVAQPADLAPTLERLGRAASAAAVRAPSRRVDAIELLVPIPAEDAVAGVAEAITPLLGPSLATQRLTLTLLPAVGRPVHLTFEHAYGNGATAMRADRDLHGIHPETAARIDLARLAKFDIERLEAPEDIYCFHARSPEIPGDERLIVFADVRGRSPDESDGREASLHVAAFERDFFEAARCLRNHLQLRDPRRRLQWNRLILSATPSVYLDRELVDSLARRLYPATRHLGLEKVVVRLNVLDRARPEAPSQQIEIVFVDPTGSRLELSWRRPHHEPLEPAQNYERKVVEARRRRLVYPYEIVRMLTGAPGAVELAGERTLPVGTFEEYDLEAYADPPRAVSVSGRPPAQNTSAIVFGIIDTPTDAVPEGMRRVLILSDPTLGMGSLAGAECDRIVAAIDLAEANGLPVEWVPVSSGARIAMDSGTENLDATARVVRRIVTFTQAGGAIHVIVQGVNVGAQSYFDALATMLLHTRGVLIMTPGASMVLTGRAALAASGSVAGEDEVAIGGYERVMGPNGEAQFLARNLAEAYAILYQHYRYAYVVPGEATPRRLPTEDPRHRDVTEFTTRRAPGHDFDRIAEIFDADSNAERKRPFAMRALMNAVIDADLGHLERWRGWAGAETAIVWDACLGGQPVTVIGIESRNVDRGGDHPADGPASFTGGTLFPLSSKKVARALNAASGVRPAVILANLSGFDGSPESMRKLQLEYGAEIARAVVNFKGPLIFLVVSRYHGGAYVVFSPRAQPGAARGRGRGLVRVGDRRRAGRRGRVRARGAGARAARSRARGAAPRSRAPQRARGARQLRLRLSPDPAPEAERAGRRVRRDPHRRARARGRIARAPDHRGRDPAVPDRRDRRPRRAALVDAACLGRSQVEQTQPELAVLDEHGAKLHLVGVELDRIRRRLRDVAHAEPLPDAPPCPRIVRRDRLVTRVQVEERRVLGGDRLVERYFPADAADERLVLLERADPGRSALRIELALQIAQVAVECAHHEHARDRGQHRRLGARPRECEAGAARPQERAHADREVEEDERRQWQQEPVLLPAPRERYRERERHDELCKRDALAHGRDIPHEREQREAQRDPRRAVGDAHLVAGLHRAIGRVEHERTEIDLADLDQVAADPLGQVGPADLSRLLPPCDALPELRGVGQHDAAALLDALLGRGYVAARVQHPRRGQQRDQRREDQRALDPPAQQEIEPRPDQQAEPGGPRHERERGERGADRDVAASRCALAGVAARGLLDPEDRRQLREREYALRHHRRGREEHERGIDRRREREQERRRDRQRALLGEIAECDDARAEHRRDRHRLEPRDVVRKVGSQPNHEREQRREAGRIERDDPRRGRVDQREALPRRERLGEHHVPRVVDDQSDHAIEPQEVEGLAPRPTLRSRRATASACASSRSTGSSRDGRKAARIAPERRAAPEPIESGARVERPAGTLREDVGGRDQRQVDRTDLDAREARGEQLLAQNARIELALVGAVIGVVARTEHAPADRPEQAVDVRVLREEHPVGREVIVDASQESWQLVLGHVMEERDARDRLERLAPLERGDRQAAELDVADPVALGQPPGDLDRLGREIERDDAIAVGRDHPLELSVPAADAEHAPEASRADGPAQRSQVAPKFQARARGVIGLVGVVAGEEVELPLVEVRASAQSTLLARIQPEHAQEEARQHDLEPERNGERGRNHQAHRAARIEIAEGVLAPESERERRPGDSTDQQQCARGQTLLERDELEQALEARVWRVQAVRDGVDLGEGGEQHRLRPDRDRGRRVQQRVYVERHARNRARTRQQQCEQRGAGSDQRESRIEEEPARAEQQQEAQVPPAVAPAAQMRRAAAPVGRERRRHLGDREPEQRRLHHHLRGELHPDRAQIEALDRVAPEAAQTAVEVARRALKKSRPIAVSTGLPR